MNTWLELDARLRTDFNINTEMTKEDIIKILRLNQERKLIIKSRKVKTARYSSSRYT